MGMLDDYEDDSTDAVSHMRNVLTGLGMNLDEQHIRDTPRRFVKYLEEFINAPDYGEILGHPFDANEHTDKTSLPGGNLVLQRGIPFRMICAHHLLPAVGHAAVCYVTNQKLVGLSKLARLVEAVGTEIPSLQEHITDKIADLLVKYLQPVGVGVVIDAEHTCMACRGVAKPNVITTTSSLRGVFEKDDAARGELMILISRRS